MSSSGARKRNRRELPVIPIAAVLHELTGAEAPTGFGWVRFSCPFHPDRTPSAAVNHELNAFACHSCGRSGDSLKLLQNELRVSFKEALERGKALAGGESSRPVRRRRASDILKGL